MPELRPAPLARLREEIGRPGSASGRVKANLSALRADRGWSLRGLSDRLAAAGHHLGPNTVWKMEKGERGIGVDDLAALCQVFDVTADAMLSVPRLRLPARLR
jgi:transcriptional regulator with XRE-family HTH domain